MTAISPRLQSIEVSDQFFSWICRFRKQTVIISPSDAVADFRDYLQDILQSTKTEKYNNSHHFALILIDLHQLSSFDIP